MGLFLPFLSVRTNAQFCRRPQRFLIEVLVGNKKTLAYCANPGSFAGCLKKGSKVLLAQSEDRSRKQKYTWLAIKQRSWIGTNTHLANALVGLSLAGRLIPSLQDYRVVSTEPKNAGGGRFDFVLERDGKLCYVEVKSATVAFNGVAQFPDSKTPRGVSHLIELTKVAQQGDRAVLIFLIQRNDVDRFRLNQGCDGDFDIAFVHARNAGVEFLAVKHKVSINGFGPPVLIPIVSLGSD